MASAVVYRNDDVTIRDQHKNFTDAADIAMSHVITAVRGGTASVLDAPELGSSSSSSNSENNKITIATCRAVYPQVIKIHFIFALYLIFFLFNTPSSFVY